MATDYGPLAAYLAAQPPETTSITLTLPEIEDILGEALPRQAGTAMWWSNTPQFRHARVWMGAGWFVTARSMRTTPATITFARGTGSLPAPFVPHRRPAPEAGRGRRRDVAGGAPGAAGGRGVDGPARRHRRGADRPR